MLMRKDSAERYRVSRFSRVFPAISFYGQCTLDGQNSRNSHGMEIAHNPSLPSFSYKTTEVRCMRENFTLQNHPDFYNFFILLVATTEIKVGCDSYAMLYLFVLDAPALVV